MPEKFPALTGAGSISCHARSNPADEFAILETAEFRGDERPPTRDKEELAILRRVAHARVTIP
ncbi:hypothetical protein SAMN05444161_8883 [Rhizobiales bacterium GAS191]|nr:hypothetical protein SAMN05444161_8883 [Rhizobiales bacterium GAS191]